MKRRIFNRRQKINRAAGIVLTLGLLYPVMGAHATTYSTVQWDGLFADQGPLYFSPQEPSPIDPVQLTLRATANNLTSAEAIVYDNVTGITSTYPMSYSGTDANGLYEFWTVTLPASADTRFYYFQANDGTSTAYYNGFGAASTAPANGPTGGDFWIAPGFTTPTWAQRGVQYQIFVDRFFNGNTANDVTNGAYTWQGNPTVQLNWGQDPELGNQGGTDQVAFAGGDLEGVDQKLSYITNSLGANILYLNPIFTANTNHKYDTQNYFQVDPHFGGNSALQQLSSDVHNSTDSAGQKGRIVLDGVFNHTGASNAWFQGAQSSQTSSYYNWYTFSSWPNSYATFEGVANLPKLNYGSTSLQGEIYGNSNSVVQTYLNPPYLIDGWRLDAPGHVGANGYDPEANGNYNDPTNHAVWQGFRSSVKAANPNAFIFGEWFEGSQPYEWLNGNQWDSSVNYNGFLQPASEWITGYDDGFNANSIDPTQLDQWLHNTLVQAPRAAQLTQVNQLSTQDTPRFGERAAETISYKTYTAPNGSTFTEPYGGTPNVWKDDLGAFLEFSYVGLPTIYYGDEYGMMGGGTNDAGKRWTFDWSQVANGGNSVFQLYQQLIALRHQYSALRDGSFMTLVADDNTNVYAFSRFDANQRMLIILNNSNTTQTETIPAADAGCLIGSTLTNVTPLVNGVTEAASYTVDSSGNITVTLPGHYATMLEQAGGPLVSGAALPAVSSNTSPLTAGQTASIYYDGSLASTASTVTMHWGYNGWNSIIDTPMVKQDNGSWKATVSIPVGSQLNVAFYNQSGTWDNNGGQNYNMEIQMPGTVDTNPYPLVAGQPATIYYDGTLAPNASSIDMHWGYNGFTGVTDTAMTKQSNGSFAATITIPANANEFNVVFHDQNNNWDNNSGNNYNVPVQ
ncbi:alpha-amylase family glycosyl hydrolase [Ferroacidibacillus organovorans]|nr:alpha-amylase family glycosyl hydrolase [Ferroacidibacillus organovorans]